MQVHGPSRTIKDDGSEVHAYLNGEFVHMTIGDVSLYIRTPEECDWLIKTAVKAKGELLAHQAKTQPAWCPAYTGPDDELDVTVYCDRKAGHPGSHHAPVPGQGGEVAWSDEPEDAYRLTPKGEQAAAEAGPARRTAGDEAHCGDLDEASHYACTSQEGHDGPEHVAWKPRGGEYHRWPVAVPGTVEPEPAAVTG